MSHRELGRSRFSKRLGSVIIAVCAWVIIPKFSPLFQNLQTTIHVESFKRKQSSPLFHRDVAHHDIQYQFESSLPGDGPLRNASMGYSYRCPISGRAKDLPPTLNDTGLFDFATRVKNKLGILFIGDSVAQQLSEAFDESSDIRTSWVNRDDIVVWMV
jgi:hypothetical protein